MKKVLLRLLLLTLVGSPIWAYSRYQQTGALVATKQTPVTTPQVLGTNTPQQLYFTVNVPARFNDNITAPNIIYSLREGKGINISEGQTPTVTNAGVTSLQDQTGDLDLVAGTGISLNGLKISNTGITSLTAGTGISIDGNKITNTYSFTPDYTQSGWNDTGTLVKLATLTDSVEVGALTASSIVVNGITILQGNVTVGNGVGILPNTDLGSDLGSSTYRFNNLWVANINSNSSQSFSGQTTFSYPPTSSTITQASVLINPTSSAADGQLLGLGIAGYQRALIDEDGDLILGYSDATSAPATDYPLNIYGHNGTRVSFVDTSGNGYFAGNVGIGTTNPTASLQVGSLLYADSTNGVVNIGGTGVNAKLYTYAATSSVPAVLIRQNGTGDIMQLKDDNNTVLSIKDGGNVGIGTTNPGQKLEVVGTIRAANGAGAGYDLSSGGLSTISSNSLMNLKAGTTFDFYTWDAGVGFTEKMTMLNNGNVGIGTTSPSQALHVVGGARPLRLSRSSYNTYWETTIATDSLNFYDGYRAKAPLTLSSAVGNEGVFIDGNVGIGTTSPTHTLEIGGASPSLSFGGYNAEAIIGQTYGSSGNLTVQGAASINFQTYNGGWGTNLYLKNTGNVGIGTTNPVAALDLRNGNFDISNTTGTGIRLGQKKIYGMNNNGFLVDDASVTSGKYRLARMGVQTGVYGTWESIPVFMVSPQTGFNWSSWYANDDTEEVKMTIANRASDSGLSFGFSTSTAGIIKGHGNTSSLSIALPTYFTSGNVGIGTTSTNQKLDISGGNLNIVTDGSGIVWGNNNDKSITFSSNSMTLSAFDIKFKNWDGAAYTEHMRLSQAGYLGIGTTAPDQLLDVRGTAQFGKDGVNDAIINSETNLYINIDSDNDDTRALTFGSNRSSSTGGTNIMTLLESGYVGIGTTDPTYKLAIQGSGTETTQFLGARTIGIGNSLAAPSIVANQQIGSLGFLNNNAIAIAGISAHYATATNGVASYLSFKTGNVADRMIIDKDGNVGIGTTAPGSKLEVVGTGYFSGLLDARGSIVMKDDRQALFGSSDDVKLGWDTDYSAVDTLKLALSGSNSLVVGTTANYAKDYDHAAETHPTIFLHSNTNPDTNNTEWGSLGFVGTGAGGGYFKLATGVGDLVLQPTGNVGIGTTSPNTLLSIKNNFDNGQTIFITDDSSANPVVDIGQFTGGYGFLRTYESGGTASNLIRSGGVSYLNGGNVGIGTTAPGQKLEVAGSIKTSSLTTGTVYSNAGVLTNTDPSDINLKDNVLSLPDGTLEKVRGLRPVSFNWKSTGNGALGFIAQDVQQIFPELVGSNSDGTLGLYTTQFIPLLTKALQEQQVQISNLDPSAVATQSAKIMAVENRVGIVEKLVEELRQLIDSFKEKFTTKQVCLTDDAGELCVDRAKLQQLLDNLPSPTPSLSPSPTPEPSLLPSPLATSSAESTASASLQ